MKRFAVLLTVLAMGLSWAATWVVPPAGAASTAFGGASDNRRHNAGKRRTQEHPGQRREREVGDQRRWALRRLRLGRQQPGGRRHERHTGRVPARRDRDGFNDLIAVHSGTGKLILYPGRGTSFGPSVQVSRGWTTNYRPVF